MYSDTLSKVEEILVRSLLSPEALARYRSGSLAKNDLLPLVPHILALSENYLNGSGAAIPQGNHEIAKAYAFYYLPINFYKTFSLLSNIPEEFWARPISVLDFGCGPGTGALAALFRAKGSVNIDLVDSNSAMLGTAKQILEVAGKERQGLNIESCTKDSIEKGYDIILALNVTNELSTNDQLNTLEKLVSSLSKNGYLFVLEPGTKVAARNLMRLRDEIFKSRGDLQPVFPCTTKAPCPMLHEAENWCHGTLNWNEPRITRQIDELTGFNKHRIKYSALLLRMGGEEPQGLRVVSDPEKSKLGLKFNICGKDVYETAILQKRNRSDLNRICDRLKHYDLVEIHSKTSPITISKDTAVFRQANSCGLKV